MSDYVDIKPWMRPYAYAGEIAHGYGLALVDWPSGRRTLEQYAGTVVMSDLELARAWDRHALRNAKMENLTRSLEDLRTRTVRSGYLIRERKGRRKPRRIVTVEWMRPSRYQGPPPVYHSVLP